MSVGAIALPRPTPVPVLDTGTTREAPGARAPEFPPPRPVGPGVLEAALGKLSLASPELMLLALEKENNNLGVKTAQSFIDSMGKYVAAEDAAKAEQLRKAIAAAHHKSWWQKFLTVFKVIAIAASLVTGGWAGAIAAGLMVTAWALEKSHPKVALGLQLAAVTILVSNAAADMIASGANAAAIASAGVRTGAKYVAGGAQVGCAIGTAMVGHYQGAELRAEAAQLLAKQLLEKAKQGQRDEIAVMKAIMEQDARVTRDAARMTDDRNAALATAIRV